MTKIYIKVSKYYVIPTLKKLEKISNLTDEPNTKKIVLPELAVADKAKVEEIINKELTEAKKRIQLMKDEINKKG